MPIPDYETVMLPFLKSLKDNKEHSLNEVREQIYSAFNLTEKEQKELLPSEFEPIINNRIRWARLYLEKAELIETTRRGFYKITERGNKALSAKPSKINVNYLKRFPEFVKFVKPKETKEETQKENKRKDKNEPLNPIEKLEEAHQRIKTELIEELLKEIVKVSPRFFENIIVELLLKMGYGGSRKDAEGQ
jgi:restriction system protein